MSKGINTEIKLKGKLFDVAVEKNLLKALNKGVEKMALVTEGRVKALTPVRTGHLRRSISGELVGDVKAQVDAGEFRQGRNVVYANWIEGVSSKNARSTYKGRGMFKTARSVLNNEDKDKYFAEPIQEALN
jgi:hypothetical protein